MLSCWWTTLVMAAMQVVWGGGLQQLACHTKDRSTKGNDKPGHNLEHAAPSSPYVCMIFDQGKASSSQ